MISLPFSLLDLRGPDAIAFAHAQFCSDVRALADAHWQWSAWLSPQGRVRAFFHLLRMRDEHLRVVLRGAQAESLAAQLAPYVFRSRVQLAPAAGVSVQGSGDAQCVGATLDVPATPLGQQLACRGDACALALPGAPARWIVCSAAAPDDGENIPPAESVNAWRLADIRAGLVEISDVLGDRLLPQWLGLERLGAVSVRKGCYPGQEIMARLHFKGGNKRALFHIACADALQVAHPLRDTHGQDAGWVVAAARAEHDGFEGLASMAHVHAADALVSASAKPIRVIAEIG